MGETNSVNELLCLVYIFAPINLVCEYLGLSPVRGHVVAALRLSWTLYLKSPREHHSSLPYMPGLL